MPVFAADVSPWDNDIRSAARLVAANARDESGARVLRAGVEIKLEPGWKTYWRYPGDSGVPPVFDFSASDNVKEATVLFPAPMRFPDGAGGFPGSRRQAWSPLYCESVIVIFASYIPVSGQDVFRYNGNRSEFRWSDTVRDRSNARAVLSRTMQRAQSFRGRDINSAV